jgi:hypothetical protein
MLITRSTIGRLFLLLLLVAATSGCNIIGGIFKAGFWSGIIVVALIVVGIVFLLGKARR